MASRSPARYTMGRNDIGINPPVGESALPEFNGGFPKSPMRDRFLNDLDSIPNTRTRSPMRERGSDDFGYGGAGKSPVRQTNFSKSPIRESNEFDGTFPKSPMRDRFLSDLGSVPSSPMRSTHVSRSPMRETVRGDFDDDDDDGSFAKSPMTQRDVSQSPMRQSRPGVSVRSRNVSRSPMRQTVRGEFDEDDDDDGSYAKSPMSQKDVGQSPMRQSRPGVSVRSRNVSRSPMRDFPKSPMRGGGLVSEFNERNVERDLEEAGGGASSDVDKDSNGKKLTVKSSFSLWLTDNNEQTAQTNNSYSGRGRRPRREQTGLGDADRISESRESAQGNDHEMTSEGSMDDHVHALNPRRKGLHRDRFQGEDSNYRPNSSSSYGESRGSFDSTRGPASVRDLEMERAELFRRYKELSEQLEGKRVLPSSGLYGGTDGYSDDDFGRFTARSMQQGFPGRGGVRRPAYYSSGPVPHTGDMYDDLFPGPSMMSRPHSRQPHQHSNYIVPGPVGGQYDYDSPHMSSYHGERHYHHLPSRYTDDWQGRDLPYSMAGRRPTHSMDLDRHNARGYDSRRAHSSTHLERKSHYQRRSQLVNLNKNLCVPICGGAPFVLCKGCFLLLKLPSKIMIKQKKNQYKLRCGGCSAVVSFDQLCKSSLSFLPTNPSQDFVEKTDSGLPAKEAKESSQDEVLNSCYATSTNVESFDFDAIGNSFQSVDSEESKAQRLGLNMADHLSPSSSSSRSSSKDDRASDNASAKMGKIYLGPPPSGSPLGDLLDYSTHFRTLQAGGGVMSHAEKVKNEVGEKDENTPESPRENRTVASEMELQSNEGPRASFSQEVYVPRKEDDDGIGSSKNGGSSVTGSVSSNERTEVYVNGQRIPPHLVKNAEKFAGTIEPGEYWYDSKAGFWGVMGHRCLGIIPPSIPEFRFSLPGNCSGGDTMVFVNGRELHKKDLDILVGRGLPATKNKRYIIDISGKVLDENTKRPVASLGKLAPTVERKKRGFGMQVPDHFDNE